MKEKGATFQGNPCSKCGATLRLVSNWHCVGCHKNYNKKWLQTQKGKAARLRYQISPKGIVNQKKCRERYCEQNHDAILLYQRQYRKTEIGKLVLRRGQHKHYAKYHNIEGSFTNQEWLQLKSIYGNCCLCCGKHESVLSSPIQQDHVVPRSKGGTNWISNIQPLCEGCNGMGGKGTKSTDYRPKQ